MTPTRRPLVIVLFAIYLALLVWIILWKLAVPWVGEAAFLPHPVKLVPFFPSGDADASNPLEVVANLLFFIPFGLYLGMLTRLPRWAAAALFAGASLVLEVTQHLLSIGSFDSTDVIMNTAGGMLGLWLLSRARRRIRPASITRALVIGTAVSLIAVAIFIASPIRYAPQHDIVVGLGAQPGEA